MFSYRWDEETGGIVLTTDQGDSSVEVRPVYARELAMLNMPWMFEMQDDVPYMWARTNQYWYRGRLVAKVHGACMYKEPKIEIVDAPEPPQTLLRPVDVEAMVAKSADRLEALEQATVKNIYHTYMKYKSRVDVFYVAFSGGKDSVVVLDIVARALPHKSFKVVFGDTRMEFSDTYDLVDEVEAWCRQNGIEFIRAQSHLSPVESWNAFGPPAQRIRWCCSVHKSTPQILKLREILAKPDFRGMAFTGIRGEESAARSQYDEISFGAKVNGQYSFHPILDWSAAEVYIYMYKHHLYINEAYKKGQGRVGCLVCPLASSKSLYLRSLAYPRASNGAYGVEDFTDIILKTSSKNFKKREDAEEFLGNMGFNARCSGKELNIARKDFVMDDTKEGVIVRTKYLSDDWKQWIKTLGLVEFISDSECDVIFKNEKYRVSITKDEDEYTITSIVSRNSRSSIAFIAALKIVFKKASHCAYCRVCEVNCPYGYIEMKNGRTEISDKCVHCRKCHDVLGGCLRANSLKLPKGEEMVKDSINHYGDMGVKSEWLDAFMKYKDELWQSDYMPVNKKGDYLCRFLNEAKLTISDRGKGRTITPFGYLVCKLNIHSGIAWGLMLCELAYSTPFQWWMKNIKPGIEYSEEELKLLLKDLTTDKSLPKVISSYKHIFTSNKVLMDEIGLGKCKYTKKGLNVTLHSVIRGTWHNPDPRVILYSLYLFAEHCDGYYQFTLSRLLDHDAESEGMSPTEIFNIDRETMKRILTGLSIDYSAFIHASFTHDLDIIDLDKTKTSKDVLSLFE